MLGETAIEEPVPSGVPPQLTVYQFQSAPVPSVPPVTLKVVDAPSQIGSTLVVAPVATAEFVLTITVTLTQEVVLQVPSALT